MLCVGGKTFRNRLELYSWVSYIHVCIVLWTRLYCHQLYLKMITGSWHKAMLQVIWSTLSRAKGAVHRTEAFSYWPPVVCSCHSYWTGQCLQWCFCKQQKNKACLWRHRTRSGVQYLMMCCILVGRRRTFYKLNSTGVFKVVEEFDVYIDIKHIPDMYKVEVRLYFNSLH